MPLYVFKCVKCKSEFDEMKKLAEPNPKCHTCKSDTEIVIRNKPVVRLKGEGFHCNDYDSVGRHEY